MQKWEYVTVVFAEAFECLIHGPNGYRVNRKDEHYSVTLNGLGEDGWELVTASPLSNKPDDIVVWTFKRPKQ